MVKTSAEYDKQRMRPRANITLSRQIRERADDAAKKLGVSLSSLVEQVLSEYLTRPGSASNSEPLDSEL